MQNYQGLLTDFYSLIAVTGGENRNVNVIGAQADDCLSSFISLPPDSEDVILTSALKSELLAASEPRDAERLARHVLSILAERGDSEINNLLKGICFYALAVAAEKLNRFSAPDKSLSLLEKAVLFYPGHWNAAFLLAEKKISSAEPKVDFTEIKAILRHAAAHTDSPIIKARYYRQIGYYGHLSGEYYDAIKYYEKANIFTALNKFHLGLLAAAYAATDQYETAFQYFYEAYKNEEIDEILTPAVKRKVQGVSHPDVWSLAAYLIGQFRQLPNCENMTAMGIAFGFLPVQHSELVIARIATYIDEIFCGDQAVFENLAKGTMFNFRLWFSERNLPLPEAVYHRRSAAQPDAAPRIVLRFS